MEEEFDNEGEDDYNEEEELNEDYLKFWVLLFLLLSLLFW